MPPSLCEKWLLVSPGAATERKIQPTLPQAPLSMSGVCLSQASMLGRGHQGSVAPEKLDGMGGHPVLPRLLEDSFH